MTESNTQYITKFP